MLVNPSLKLALCFYFLGSFQPGLPLTTLAVEIILKYSTEF